MTTRSRKRGNASMMPTLLLALLAGGAGFVAFEAQRLPIDVSAVAMAAPASASGQSKSSSGDVIADAAAPPPSLVETTTRPLFNPSRRPIVPQKPKVAEAPPPPPVQPLKAELVGLAATTSKGPLALLRTASDRSASWLSVGEEVGGWRLSEIRPDRVVFQSGDQKQELQLFPVRGKTKRVQ